jgi:HSP20 family protein
MSRVLSSVLELMRLQSEMNRIFEVLEALESEEDAFEIEYAPAYDIFETPSSTVVEMDLAGTKPDSLKVTAIGDHVVIEGVRGHGQKRASAHYHLMERAKGKFKRNIRIDGAFNTHMGEAVFKRGVLRIDFPKVKDRRGSPHPIEVKQE